MRLAVAVAALALGGVFHAAPAHAIALAQIGQGLGVVLAGGAGGPGSGARFTATLLGGGSSLSASTSEGDTEAGSPAAVTIVGAFPSFAVSVAHSVFARTDGPGSATAMLTASGAIRITNDGTAADAPIVYFYDTGWEGPATLVDDLLVETASIGSTGSLTLAGIGSIPLVRRTCSASAPNPFVPADCSAPLLFLVAGGSTFANMPELDPGESVDVSYFLGLSAAVTSTAVPAPATFALLAGALAVAPRRRRRKAPVSRG